MSSGFSECRNLECRNGFCSQFFLLHIFGLSNAEKPLGSFPWNSRSSDSRNSDMTSARKPPFMISCFGFSRCENPPHCCSFALPVSEMSKWHQLALFNLDPDQWLWSSTRSMALIPFRFLLLLSSDLMYTGFLISWYSVSRNALENILLSIFGTLHFTTLWIPLHNSCAIHWYSRYPKYWSTTRFVPLREIS